MPKKTFVAFLQRYMQQRDIYNGPDHKILCAPCFGVQKFESGLLEKISELAF